MVHPLLPVPRLYRYLQRSCKVYTWFEATIEIPQQRRWSGGGGVGMAYVGVFW